jgi:transcriptional regulator with XRE-family HTH domain
MSKRDQPTKAYTFNRLKELLPSEEERRLFAQDACMLAATEAIVRAMDEQSVTQSQLAAKIGKGRAYVSQRLNGAANMTLKTLADMLWALGLEVRDLKLAKLGESTVSAEMMDLWLDGESKVVAAESTNSGDRKLNMELFECEAA